MVLKQTQRYSLFKICNTINKKICDVIIYSRNCENIKVRYCKISLSLQNTIEITIDEVCKVPFFVRKKIVRIRSLTMFFT